MARKCLSLLAGVAHLKIARIGFDNQILREISPLGYSANPRCIIRVSGGAGFLGSHLCERLLERGDEVLCVDNFFSSTRHNVAHLLDNHRVEMPRQRLIPLTQVRLYVVAADRPRFCSDCLA